MANTQAVTDPERLAQLLGRLKEVCSAATQLANEVRTQLRDVERDRQAEGKAALKRAGRKGVRRNKGR